MRIIVKMVVALFLCLSGFNALADKPPRISAWVIKKNSQKNCAGGGTYLGPNNVNDHWGTCVKVEGIKIESRYTRDRKTCKGSGWAYVGPNRAHDHGGYCAKLSSKKWMLRADEERSSKNCGSNRVYAGANNVKAHWGHCLSVVKNGSWKAKIISNQDAVSNSEKWECVRKDRVKSQGSCPGDVISVNWPTNDDTPKGSDFIKFELWRGVSREGPCNQDSKNRIAKFAVNKTSEDIKARIKYKKYSKSDDFKKMTKTIEINGGDKKLLDCLDHLNQNSPIIEKVWDSKGNLLAR